MRIYFSVVCLLVPFVSSAVGGCSSTRAGVSGAVALSSDTEDVTKGALVGTLYFRTYSVGEYSVVERWYFDDASLAVETSCAGLGSGSGSGAVRYESGSLVVGGDWSDNSTSGCVSRFSGAGRYEVSLVGDRLMLTSASGEEVQLTKAKR